MSVQVEKLENNMAKLTVTVSADKLGKAIQSVYEKQKSKISVPGFRKGKVPRAMIEKVYGKEIFYEDAVNEILPEEYPLAVDESGLDIVSRPAVDIVQLESGKDFIFTAEVAVKPEVTLGKYKGITVTKIDTTVSEEEIDAEIENTRNMQSRIVDVTDRPVQDGDNVLIDYEGFVDGVPFEGGKDENHSLEIGSHTFIDNFEEQLIGKNINDEVDVNVTFPEQYHAKELAGKPALFKVKILGIKAKELPELDDEFASMVSESETMADYREEVRAELKEHKEANARKAKEDEAVAKIVEKSKMDIPEPMIEYQCENMVRDFANRLARQGLSMEQYMQFSGQTMDKLQEQVRPEAIQNIKGSLVLEQIAIEENLEVSDAEIDEDIERMAVAYGMQVDQLKEMIGDDERDSIRVDLSVQKALAFVMDNAKERAKAKKKDTENASESEETEE